MEQLPLTLSFVFTFINIAATVFALQSQVENYWWTRRNRVAKLYDTFISGETARSRDIIGTASRKKRRTTKQAASARVAVFDLLWKIESIHLIKGDIRTSSVTHEQGRLLYRHLGKIVYEINQLLSRHPHLADFSDSIAAANEALDRLKDLRNSWEEVVKRAPIDRIQDPAVQRSV